jgi:DNA adenine methylase
MNYIGFASYNLSQYIYENYMTLPPFFCRIGTKKKVSKELASMVPPNYKLYVEPFVGGGAMFVELYGRADKYVINDLDKDLIQGWKLLKKGVELSPFLDERHSVEEYNHFYKKPPRNNSERLSQLLLQACGTFGSNGMGKIYNTITGVKNKLIPAYRELLQNTTVLNRDYKEVIKKYDGINTFFFIDPPYEESSQLYKNGKQDFEELLSIVSSIKGRFMLTLNDSPTIRKLFSKFSIKKTIITRTTQNSIGKKTRGELIITNY